MPLTFTRRSKIRKLHRPFWRFRQHFVFVLNFQEIPKKSLDAIKNCENPWQIRLELKVAFRKPKWAPQKWKKKSLKLQWPRSNQVAQVLVPVLRDLAEVDAVAPADLCEEAEVDFKEEDTKVVIHTKEEVVVEVDLKEVERKEPFFTI